MFSGGKYSKGSKNREQQPDPPSDLPAMICTSCNKPFRTADGLMTHMTSLNHGTWHYCPHCDWSYVAAHLLQAHIGSVHGAQVEPRRERSSRFADPNTRDPHGQTSSQQPSVVSDRSKKKDYDRIVKTFLDDESLTELEFPSTLNPSERHLIHKLAMQYDLIHKSSGEGAARVLKLSKKNIHLIAHQKTLKADKQRGEVKEFEGFQGVQPLDDDFLRSNLDAIEGLLDPVRALMVQSLHNEVVRITTEIGRRTFRKKGFRGAANYVASPLVANPTTSFQARRGQQNPLRAFREKLPTYQQGGMIVSAVRNNAVVVVCGDTGCGKTTQVPQLLYDSGIFPKGSTIICTQPRRISAISVSTRVAQERGETVGKGTVGYIIRFENLTCPSTRILYCTTGILLRRLQSDPLLEGVSCVVVDEVHERDLDTDVSLLLLRDLLFHVMQERGKTPSSGTTASAASSQSLPSLRLVIMSATIEVEKLQKYFSAQPPLPSSSKTAAAAPPTGLEITVPILRIPGTLFPVEEYFLEDALQWTNMTMTQLPVSLQSLVKPEARKQLMFGTSNSNNNSSSTAFDAVHEAAFSDQARNLDDLEMTVPNELIVQLIVSYHTQYSQDRRGAILVFLPGWGPIDRISNLLRATPCCRELSILILHSSISCSEQARVFDAPPRGFRKVILSTNIAETSVTIDDVTLVIDSGLQKGTSYDPMGNTSSLQSQIISKANGLQRRGRAGRCQAGVCVHLLPKALYDTLPQFQTPEILRTPLEEVCLHVKALTQKREDPQSLNLYSQDVSCAHMLLRALDSPPLVAITHALEFLRDLSAIDANECITNLGRALALMPLHPLVGKLLLVSATLGVLNPIAVIASTLGAKSPFLKPLPHQLGEAKQILESLSGDNQSDHFAVYELFRRWKTSRNQHEFCLRHIADFATLRGMDRTQAQLKRLVMSSGYFRNFSSTRSPPPAPSSPSPPPIPSPLMTPTAATEKRKRTVSDVEIEWYSSRNESNVGLIRFALLWALYPRIAVVEQHRVRRQTELFCWDSKPSVVHPSSVLSCFFRRNGPSVPPGCEFLCYYDRMKVESQLFLFDITLVSRTATLLSCSDLVLIPPSTTVQILEIRDEESKYGPWKPQKGSSSTTTAAADQNNGSEDLSKQCTAARGATTTEVTQLPILVMDGGKKRYELPSMNEARTLLQLHDALEYFFSLAISHVDITLFPSELIRALGLALGYPVKEQQVSSPVLDSAIVSCSPSSETPPSSPLFVAGSLRSSLSTGPTLEDDASSPSDQEENGESVRVIELDDPLLLVEGRKRDGPNLYDLLSALQRASLRGALGDLNVLRDHVSLVAPISHNKPDQPDASDGAKPALEKNEQNAKEEEAEEAVDADDDASSDSNDLVVVLE